MPVSVDSFDTDGPVVGDLDHAIEAEADIEMAITIAPRAQVVVYETPRSDCCAYDLALTEMASDTQHAHCNQLSTSWTIESFDPTNLQLFSRVFPSLGQTFFQGAGDDGAYSNPGYTPQSDGSCCSGGYCLLGVAQQWAENFLTSVGGTVLTKNSDGVTYSESAWTYGGGGYDNCIVIPSYQQNMTAAWALNGGSATGRNFPDVSGEADHNVTLVATSPTQPSPNTCPTAVTKQQIIHVGGTSLSSPLWAGFMALVNEQNQHNLFQPVGFANPALYGIGKSNVAGNCFTDIHDGTASSEWQQATDSCNFPADTLNGPGFSTVSGYDLATGWGSPKCGLINQLASSTPLPALGISAGFEHACAVMSDRTVRCWGYNGAGELGNNSTVASSVPVTATVVSTVAAISAGSLHTCALLAGGTVQCWGDNANGQLGNGTTTDSLSAVNVSGLSTAISICAGNNYTCAVLASGVIQCWGGNPCGNLGNGNTTDSNVPVTVSGISNALGVAPGVDHTCAWTADGHAYCWGCNDYGQLGNGSINDSAVPVETYDDQMYPVTAVSSGADYSCALGVNGVAYCWGLNDYGTLGNGQTYNGLGYFNWAPVAVLGISSATGISAGYSNACAVLADGTVQCWGLNNHGGLGNGSTGGIIASPVSVLGLSQAVAVAAGSEYSCALSPGAVTCWGDNVYSDLGNGTTTESSIPTPVTFH